MGLTSLSSIEQQVQEEEEEEQEQQVQEEQEEQEETREAGAEEMRWKQSTGLFYWSIFSRLTKDIVINDMPVVENECGAM